MAAAEEAAPFDKAAYIREAISVMQARALNAGQVDWAAVEAEALTREAGARDDIDMLDTIVWMLTQLGDNHSFPQIARDRLALYQERYNAMPWPPYVPRDMVSTFMERSEPSVTMMRYRGRNIAHVVVPQRRNASVEVLNAYAQTLFDGLDVNRRACGFVVDLRGNTGGNSWPMLTGLSPLLGQGRIGGSQAPGFDDGSWLRGGELWSSDRGEEMRLFTFEGWRASPDLSRAPVAVLIDDATGSSGESTALAFRGRANTRHFGIHTAGASTATQGFMLSDGTNLVIATDVMTDRNGVPYPRGLEPDVEVDPTGASEGKPDHAMAAALAWLRAQRGCRGIFG